MGSVFDYDQFDDNEPLSKKFKSEARIVLASMPKNTYEYYDMEDKLENALRIVRSIDGVCAGREEEAEELMGIVNKFWKTGLLSPLTLKDDEFEERSDREGFAHNKRYYHISLFRGKVYNANAYMLQLKKKKVKYNPEFHLASNGVLTGVVVSTCVIPDDVVKEHCYTIQSVVAIPAVSADVNGTSIFVVEESDKKLAALKQFYNLVKRDEPDYFTGIDITKLNIKNKKL